MNGTAPPPPLEPAAPADRHPLPGSTTLEARRSGEAEGRPPPVTLPAGTLLGSYRILETLGVGAMGIVYLAEHVVLGRKVALKMLRSEYTGDRNLLSRFYDEARAVNRIAHAHVVEVTDFQEDGAGGSWYIMELLTGSGLDRLLRTEGAIPPARAIDISMQICEAMSATHRAGVVHRDLKPENIYLVQRDGRTDFVKILDFGVAKLLDREHAGIRRTAHGALLGTPQYMSPEQAAGRDSDHRADIYALGVVLYEMVTGHCPFDAATVGEVMVKHLTVVPSRPRRLPGLRWPVSRALDRIVMRCLAKFPEERYASMDELHRALRAAARIERRLETLGLGRWPLARLASTRARRAGLALLGAVAVTAGLGLLAVPAGSPPRSRASLEGSRAGGEGETDPGRPATAAASRPAPATALGPGGGSSARPEDRAGALERSRLEPRPSTARPAPGRACAASPPKPRKAVRTEDRDATIDPF